MHECSPVIKRSNLIRMTDRGYRTRILTLRITAHTLIAHTHHLVCSPPQPGTSTEVTLRPYLERFGMQTIDEDTLSLLKRRVFDLAGTVKDVKKINLYGFTMVMAIIEFN
ncbi:hypothetical protein BDR07DRAFT_1529565 [Suillus spraguei]|nr:hypothetical protein BDR07DRAFT_1529565 [Suillus spraguei]